jgi:single-strand DNA-binding protein
MTPVGCDSARQPVCMTSIHASDAEVTECTVHLIGRLGSKVHDRELPSGDVVSTFTVVVDRGRGSRAAGSPVSNSKARVDAIPCQAFRPSLRSRIARLDPGTLVEVQGTLRRRFWRSPGGVGSALEVDVNRLRRA